MLDKTVIISIKTQPSDHTSDAEFLSREASTSGAAYLQVKPVGTVVVLLSHVLESSERPKWA
jgi:hypothetical protein